MRVCVLLFWVALALGYRHVQNDMQVQYHLDLHEMVAGVNNLVYIHAAVGIFRKIRKPNETWGYGREILEELLHDLSVTPLGKNVSSVYVSLLGRDEDRDRAMKTLATFNSTESTLVGKIRLLATSSNLYLAEFPTLLGIQEMAGSMLPDNNILYLHTKGMRNNGAKAADWRRYMSHFLVNRSEVCLEALSPHHGYQTCGVQFQPTYYQGNFWWSKAGWINDRHMNLASIKWDMGHRMVAERFLFSPSMTEFSGGGRGSIKVEEGTGHLTLRGRRAKGIPRNSTEHYCLFYVDHNLYDCPTPPELYRSHSLLPLRSKRHSQCLPRFWGRQFQSHSMGPYKDHEGIECIGQLAKDLGGGRP